MASRWFCRYGGSWHELEKFNRSGLPLATHSLQYVLDGFTGFRWPVAFYASKTATAHQLYVTFLEVLEALLLAGFTVDYLSMDGASTNRAFTDLLFPGTRRDQEFLALNVFHLDHSYAVLQDIKHCLKKIRNSLEASRECNLAKGGYLKALAWFKSYLSGRTLRIKIDKSFSELQDILWSVPKGSVVGPLLFLIYLLPLGKLIRKHGLELHIYADDTQLYLAIEPITQQAVICNVLILSGGLNLRCSDTATTTGA